MTLIVRTGRTEYEEIAWTEFALAATHDSRLGFLFVQDCVYTPYSLWEKLQVPREALENQLPERRKMF